MEAADDLDSARAPAAAPVSATTELEYCQARFDWFRETIIDAYKNTSDDPPPLRERAAEWLANAARADCDLGGAPTWGDVYAEGEALVEAGVRHPLVLGYVAHCNQVQGRLKRSRERHDLVAESLLSGEYGALPKFYEAWRLMELEHRYGCERRHPSERVVWDAWVELAAIEATPVRQRMLWRDLDLLLDAFWLQEDSKQWLAEVATDERLTPWLSEMIAGKIAYDKAWKIRGGGYASEVDEEKWKPFHDLITESKSHFLAAYELHPGLPEACVELTGIAVIEEGPEAVRGWFDEARRAQVDYLPAYEKLLWGMLPQWHGDYGVMYGYAQQWYDEGRFDTNAPYMTLKAVYKIGSWTGGWLKPLRSEEPYTLVMSALQAMADDPGHGADRRRTYTRAVLLTHQVAVGIRAGHDDDARRALDTLTDEGLSPDYGVMRYYGAHPEMQIPRLYARTGLAAEAVAALGNLTAEEQNGDRAALVRTIEAYREAKRLTKDPRADAYFDHWDRVYSMELAFVDGDWATPIFSDQFDDWHRPVEGLWEVESPSAAVSRQSSGSGEPMLWTACSLREPYEVEVEIEPLYEAGPNAWNGVYAGDNKKGVYFWINRTAGGAAVSLGLEHPEIHSVGVRERYLLSARVWPGYVELWVDGQKVTGRELPEFTPSGYFALATVDRCAHGAEVRYHHPRFRKLGPRPDADEATGGE